ncbi:hypothetical protein BSZ39_05635 [Bowdeniella nasicola]|uniref:Peptidase S9 n=1 Tax=Bowdeniella nasicola TaxID=208480 RepID=A0A1Q5Q378_9ACTO|nr:hypothetical protein [Bowdeniella nasicola]OKL54142.1 hypothetical protein BSZ39_05635 [Bowdeniella nasicola]
MTSNDQLPDLRRNLPLTLGIGAGTFAYYALPDVVRSRTARGLLKTGLVAGMTAAYFATDLSKENQEACEEASNGVMDRLSEVPMPLVATGIIGSLAASIAVTVWVEKSIFARGERRRAAGVRGAHTRQAIGLGVLGALAGVGL